MSAALSNEESAYLRQSSGSGWFVGIIVALALLAIGYLVFSANDTKPSGLLSPYVKIETNSGHGSATHIGDGYFVTAAHVVARQGGLRIKATDNSIHDLEIMWFNQTYDVALLRVAKHDRFASVPMSCSIAAVGTRGESHGNPMFIENITTNLVVAGSVRSFGDTWPVAIPVDGALAGVNVGVLLAPTGGLSASMFGVNVVVPSSVVCDLMGRK